MRHRHYSLPIILLLFFVVITIDSKSTALSNFSDNISLVYSADSIKTGSNDSLKIEDDLKQGKILYEKKCQKCHSLYDPGDFKLKVWKKNLKEMRQKAELSKDEYNLILVYLSKNCKK